MKFNLLRFRNTILHFYSRNKGTYDLACNFKYLQLRTFYAFITNKLEIHIKLE